MTMQSVLIKACWLVLISTLLTPVQADNGSEWQKSASANLSLISYSQNDLLDVQNELSLFIDASRFDNSGLGAGYIRQSQAQSNRQDIINNMLFLTAWQAFYPESLPGKLTAYVDFYRGNESISGSARSQSVMPGNRVMSKAGPAGMSSTSFTDSLRVINPALGFTSYSKSYALELSYAQSQYDSGDTTVGKLTVDQWSPAVAILFNDQYDRLQLRHYAITLSNDTRTPGVDNTNALELKWTHWLKPGAGKLHHIQLIVLLGERLYAVDREARKIYNLADRQDAAYSLGGNWQLSEDRQFYIYGGLEKYTDLAVDNDYTSVFIYLGIAQQW